MHNNINFNIVHWNCFKLTSTRIEEVNFFLNYTKTDVLCLNEIKLNNFEVNQIDFPGYSFLSKTRTNSGGGVGIIIKKELSYILLDIFDH